MRLLALLATLATTVALHAAVTPAPIFADNAVLQHGCPVPVWGAAAAGEQVAVAYLGQNKTVTTSADGRWMIVLDPMPPNQTGTLVIKGRNTLAFANVVTGEVWVASGQSNMSLQTKHTASAKEETASADCPGIREFKVALAVSTTPAGTLAGRWTPCTPQSAGDYGAVAYYFARKLHAALKMPVGIITIAKGGTPIEAWMSDTALKNSGLAGTVATRWQKTVGEYPGRFADYNAKTIPEWEAKVGAAKAAGKPSPPKPSPPKGGPGDYRIPTGLYGGMIHPLIPFALRGAIWYQGEANAGHPLEYPPLFEAMVTDWRRSWGQGDFPFLYVQLPNFEAGRTFWPHMREAQAISLPRLPGLGMAVTIDIGDPNDVHPGNKRDVGDRLARIALAKVYAQSIAWSGPIAKSAARENDTLRIRFEHTGGVLQTRAKLPPGEFEVAGADGKFSPAKTRIEGDSIIAGAAGVSAPVYVRYAWKNNPAAANLVGADKLPAPPFILKVSEL